MSLGFLVCSFHGSVHSTKQRGEILSWFQLIVTRCAELLLHTSGSIQDVRVGDQQAAPLVTAEH